MMISLPPAGPSTGIGGHLAGHLIHGRSAMMRIYIVSELYQVPFMIELFLGHLEHHG